MAIATGGNYGGLWVPGSQADPRVRASEPDPLTDQLTDDLVGDRAYRPRRNGTGDQLGQTVQVGSTQPRTSAPTPAPVIAPATPASYRIQPVDQAKFDDPNKHDGKYDYLRTVSAFDPTKGFTPDVIAALNKLGYGTFSGSGDKLSYSDVTDAGRAAGLEAGGFSGDFIQNYGNGTNPNAQWAWDWRDPNAGATAQPTINPVTAALAARSGGGTANAYEQGGVTGGSAYAPGTDTSDFTPAQAAAAGLGWVDKNNPNFGQPGFIGGKIGGTAAAAPTDAGQPKTDLESMLAQLIAQNDAAAKQNAEFSNRIHGTVLDEIDKGSAPVDPNDPSIAGPMNVYSQQQDKALAAGREAMAARAQSGGMPTGAFDASLQSSYENLGSDKAAYNSSLVTDQLKQRQAQLQNALSTGAGLLTADEARNVQTQLAAISARLQKMDLDQSGAIANRDLDVRSDLGQGQLALAQQTEADRQNNFYDSMGLDIGNRQSALDAAMMQLLGQ